MALTAFGTNDSQTVKHWSETTLREALKQTFIYKFLGKRGDKKGIINWFTELEKNAGDQIRFDLIRQATNDGIDGDNILEDNEEAMVYHQDSFTINQKRNAHAFGAMSQQRTLHDLYKDARANMADWAAMIFDSYFFRYACGDTTLSFAGNTGTAPTNTRWSIGGDVTYTGVIATDEGNLGTNDQMQLADIDIAKEMAHTATPQIKPVMIEGKEHYVMVVHDYQLTDIRIDAATSAFTTWPEIQMNAASRGDSNILFKTGLGVYNDVILFSSSRILTSPNNANVKRAVLMGQQAMAFGLGNAHDNIGQSRYGKDMLFKWIEQERDYQNRKGIGVGMTFGMKKIVFNSLDNGIITVPTYAAKHYSAG